MKRAIITTSDYLDFNLCKSIAGEMLKDEKKRNVGLYILTAIYSGLRNSDLNKLKWKDVYPHNHILEHKTKKARFEPFGSKTLLDILNQYRPINEDTFVFTSQKGTPYTIQAMNRTIKDVFKAYAIGKNISTHTFRKTFGRTLWDRNGKDEETLILLMDIFNHSSLVMTRKYLGITHEEIKAKLLVLE